MQTLLRCSRCDGTDMVDELSFDVTCTDGPAPEIPSVIVCIHCKADIIDYARKECGLKVWIK